VPAINKAYGSVNIPTNTLAANVCSNITATNANIGVNDIPDWTFGADYSANAGFIPGSSLYVMSTAGAANVFTWKLCNQTGSNVTPASGMVILWRDRL
jgi:hypothetical protein